MAAPVTDADMGLNHVGVASAYHGDGEDVAEGQEPSQPPLFSAEEAVEGFPLEPSARTLFRVCPWMRNVPVFGEASAAYGPKTTLSLGTTYFMVKGIADQLVRATMYAMLVTRMGADAAKYQRLTPMVSMGWSVKAFTAMFSDGLAFMGYTKRWYIAASAILGGVFALAYAVLPAKPSSADLGGAFVFLTSFFKANFDILAEGHYSRLMRKIPAAGSSLVTWIWLLILLGHVVASCLTGPVSDLGKPQICIYVAAALQAITVIFPVFNWYGEHKNRVERAQDARMNYLDAVKEHQRVLERERAEAAEAGSTGSSDVEVAAITESGLAVGENKNLHPELSDEVHVEQADVLDDGLTYTHGPDGQLVPMDHEAAAEEAAMNVPPPTPCCCGLVEINKQVIMRDTKVFIYCAVMTLSAVAMMISNILAPRIAIVVVCVCVCSICCGLSFWALPLTIAKANVFCFLHFAVYLQIGVMDNFYMAAPACLKDGPHFTFTFYKTVGSVIGNIAGIIGTLGFHYIFSKRSYRMTFIVTTSMLIIASVFDIIIIKRWNIAIGIPDHAMYICGDAIIYQVCDMLAWMPMVILLSRLCPRGSESVVYALMAGFSNLGQSTGSVITSILIEWVWPIKSKVPCNFDNLVWLVVVGHLCTPLLIFPLTLLLPSARCCDDLDVDGKAIHRDIVAKRKKGKHHRHDHDETAPGKREA